MILVTSDISKRYGDLDVLKNINITLSKGDVYGLLGPNGAGKTTLINILCGLITPSSGTASICGYDISKHPLEARQKIGYLPDNVVGYENMTAIQNLLFFSQLGDVPKEEITERIEELLSVVGLEEWGNKKIKLYSKGMKQKFGFAQALIRDPDLILLDEPTQGIDPEGREEIRGILNHLSKNKNKTFLMATQNLNDAIKICNQYSIMKKGVIYYSGKVENAIEEKELFDFRDAVNIFHMEKGDDHYE